MPRMPPAAIGSAIETPPGGQTEAEALDDALAALEVRVYQSLHGLADTCDALARQADEGGFMPQAIRARLLASDARSRDGEPARERELQLALYAAAAPWPALACRAASYLVSSCDRLGERIEAMRWVRASLCLEQGAEPSAWRAEALMVAAMMSVSRSGADYTLVDQSLAAVRAACGPLLLSVTAANFAELAAECGDLFQASRFADDAVATLLRHPEATSALTWESVARARLASGETTAAQHAMRASMDAEERFGCCDVNGDPWLTHAEVRLALDDAAGALEMLDHPRRSPQVRGSLPTNTRDLKVRAQVLAALGRWQEAYGRMVEYVDAYQHIRSIEGDLAVAESSAAIAVEEERRRSQQFERLALTDPLTGLPNRRHAERWLAEQAARPLAASGAAEALCLAIVDLDHFKSINDTYSHDAGDLVLQRVGAVLLRAFLDGHDPDDGITGHAPRLAARLGGEEFLLAWRGVPDDTVLRESHALCELLRATSFIDIVGGMQVTASLGLAFGTLRSPASALLHVADACLYDAKRAGRDRLIAAHVCPVPQPATLRD